MKKIWNYIAAFFIGFAGAMTIAFFGKKTIIIKHDENNQIEVKRPKIKGDSSVMDIDSDLVKNTDENLNKENTNLKKDKKFLKRILKNRREKK